MTTRAPIFSRAFLLLCAATLASAFAQYLVLTAVPLLLTELGFSTAFVGAFIGAFALGALIVRIPVGRAVDRFGSRAFRTGGSALLSLSCVLYALAQTTPARASSFAAVPLLLALAGIAHSAGFSVYGTSSSSFVAYTVPPARRGEAVSYFLVLMSVAAGGASGVSLLIIAAWGFPPLLALSALLALLSTLLSALLRDPARERSRSFRSRLHLETRILPPSLASSALAASNGAALAFVTLLGFERGISNPGIFYTTSSLATIFFRFVAGRLADTYGRLVAIVPGMLVASAGLVLVAGSFSLETLALAGILFGLGTATARPAFQALAIDLATPGRRGTAMATYLAMVDLGVSIGSLSAGQIAAAVGYGGVFLAAGAAPFSGLCLFLIYLHFRPLPAAHHEGA